MQGAQEAIMVLNSEKLIEHINTEGEDVTGLREVQLQELHYLILREIKV